MWNWLYLNFMRQNFWCILAIMWNITRDLFDTAFVIEITRFRERLFFGKVFGRMQYIWMWITSGFCRLILVRNVISIQVLSSTYFDFSSMSRQRSCFCNWQAVTSRGTPIIGCIIVFNIIYLIEGLLEIKTCQSSGFRSCGFLNVIQYR